MKSLPSVIKSGCSAQKDSSVLIPDELPPPPPPAEGMEPEEGEGSPPPGGALSEEELESRCAARLEQARLQGEECLRKAREETTAIRERAAREGYAAGTAQKAEEIESCIRSVQEEMERMEEDLEAFLSVYREGLADLAVDIAQKVIGGRIEKDELVLTELVDRAVDSMKKAEWIRVEVSEQLPRLLEHLQTELSGADGVEFVGKDLPPGACLVQAPEGILDASVESQLENIRQVFQENEE